jgi:hypothetical protein
MLAAQVRAGEVERFAKEVGQRHPRFDASLELLSVDRQAD